MESENCRLLIDCGLSLRETEKRLHEIGRRAEDLDAVLLTHEHQDHARGLEALLRKKPVVVAGTRGTLRALRLPGPTRGERVELVPGRPRAIGPVEVLAFRIPHDAAEPVGFRLGCEGALLGHVTDLGHLSDEVRAAMVGLDTMVIESNHDVEALLAGPYPARLKKRILSRHGHLSNAELCAWLCEADLAGLQRLYLAHLSRTNNRPEIALGAAASALGSRTETTELRVSTPFHPTALEEVSSRSGAAALATSGTIPRAVGQLTLNFEEAAN